MSEGKNYLKVGTFVATGLAALIVSLFLLGGTKFLQENEKLYVEFEQAQGLAAGSVVSLSGLTVGNVRSLTMAKGRNVIIADLDIEAKYFGRITDLSKISVKTQGALGDKYIFIDLGAGGGNPLAPGATLVSDFQPDFLEVLSSQTNQVGGSAVDVIQELNVLLKQLNNQNRSASLMENLLGTSQNLNKLTKDPELKEALTRLNSILRKIDQGDGTLGALVNDATLHDRLVNFLGESPRNKYLVPLIRESIKSADR